MSRAIANASAAVGLVLLAGGVWLVAYHRAAPPDTAFDFTHFYRDARYVWQHAALNRDWENPDESLRPQLPFYPPAVPLLLAPLAALGPAGAAALWASLHVLALLAALRTLVRWTSPAAVAAACLLALPAFYEAARFNQLTFIVLALVLPVADAGASHRPWRGAPLGAAAVLKLLPGVLLVWLACKRHWSTLTAALAATVVVALAPCLVVFGPARTAAYHLDWLRYNVRGTPVSGMLEDGARPHFFDHRNQSFTAVAARALWSGHPAAAPWRPLDLSRDAAVWVGRAALLVAAAAFLWAIRPARTLPNDRRLRAEAAACLLAMIIFSPLVRTYYLLWALPTLALAAESLRAKPARLPEPPPSSPYVSRPRAIIILVAWLVGMLAWLSDAARAYGAHLAVLIVIAAALLAARRQARAASVNSVISGGQFQRSL